MQTNPYGPGQPLRWDRFPMLPAAASAPRHRDVAPFRPRVGERRQVDQSLRHHRRSPVSAVAVAVCALFVVAVTLVALNRPAAARTCVCAAADGRAC